MIFHILIHIIPCNNQRCEVKIFTLFYFPPSAIAAWGANHCAIVHGHVGDRLITLASMLRIPVALHNISDERIYRPHAFGGFGTSDLESQDFKACEYYGPLYR